MTQKIVVHLGNRSYPIFITHDCFKSLGPVLKKMNLGKEILMIANPDARRHYGDLLQRRLTRSGFRVTFTKQKLPTGKNSEKAKSQIYADRVIHELVEQERKGKRPLLAAFSGGVLGDLTGYVAAIYKRGVPYIQIPTTLLAQVDSSIGGKVGIDLPQGKNLLGAFYQPRLVYADLSVLDKLPKENLIEGLAEVVKYGVIADSRLFRYLEKNCDRILQKGINRATFQHIVWSCAKIKAKVIAQDERDNKGIRVILNFGHTLGHAIEQAKGYRERHGRAISVGMLCEAEIALRLGLFKRQEFKRLEALLLTLGLPTTLRGVPLKSLFRAESIDKKFIHGKNRYVLPVRIGKGIVREGISYTLIRRVVSERIFE